MSEYIIGLHFTTLIQVCITIVFIAIFFLLWFYDKREDERMRQAMTNNVDEQCVEQFEIIYNQISDSDLFVAEKEKKKRKEKYIRNRSLVIGSIIFVILFGDNIWFGLFCALILIVMGIYIVIMNSGKRKMKINQGSMYKQQVIKQLIHFINPKIQYESRTILNFQRDIYLRSGFKDYLPLSGLNELNTNRIYSDYMYFTMRNGMSVVISDLLITTSASFGGVLFDGLIVEMTRLYENTKQYKVQSKENVYCNKIEGVSNKFEDYFIACWPNGKQIVLEDDVKSKLVELYKKYKIMFEISAKGKNIYVRFYTGKMFESDLFGPLLNKKKLYNEYVIFTNVLEIIKELSEIL